jgi:hypothetical protein
MNNKALRSRLIAIIARCQSDNPEKTVDEVMEWHDAAVKEYNTSKCDNCGEMVEWVSEGYFCPECYC